MCRQTNYDATDINNNVNYEDLEYIITTYSITARPIGLVPRQLILFVSMVLKYNEKS
jgi:hypothetical protein